MSQSQQIRKIASRIRKEVLADKEENGIISASELINLTAEYYDLMLLPKAKAEMRNSLAILQSEFILFDKTLPESFKNYCLAHEIGHFILHQNQISCDAEDISDISEDAKTSAQAHVGYGAGERKEREANLFALEFLLPCDKLRQLFINEKMSADEISKAVGLPKDYVFSQLIMAVLTPPIVEKDESKPIQPKFDLDESQRIAANSEKTPLLISAGPGTGKTQTLVKRVLFLLENGVSAKNILALTFSNKAAEEMRERVAQVRPEEAKDISMMTFHAFGLELLRKYWKEANLESQSPLIDPIDALLYLEKNLLKLQLNHYQELSEPTRYLKSILSAISRAKDELCSPEKYLELAEKMQAEAVDEKAKVTAEKAVETARVYRFYQEYLENEKLLDFGELIYRAVILLQEDETVKSLVRNSYDAVLVDEFQDVNRACGVLLKEITVDGKGLWAVGDLRQSIYRWRGASPTNLRQFSKDFPNAETHSLKINYRSNQEVINLFGEFAKKMLAVSEDIFADWEANRENDENAKISYLSADTIETEAEELAERVISHKNNEIEFEEQAVICRTHSQLAKFAEILTKKGIPVFYLGELFEREEISDLLSLLDLRDSLNGFSLVRVANFAEYKIPFSDVQNILEKSGEEEKDFQQILLEDEVEISNEGKMGWNLLKKHLKILSETKSAYQFLCEYLFNQSTYLQSFLTDIDIQKQQNLLAIFQFLNFSKSNEHRFAEHEKPISSFLRHVRTVARYGEDNLFNQVPACAEKLEAVKLLTIHAAKGLEFKSVYLPYLANTKFPSKPQNEFCPPPIGMLSEERDYHTEEEECLFFVAMSRAKDFLHLSRAKYDRNSGKESLFLEKLGEFLPEAKAVSRDFQDEEVAELQPLEQFNGYHFYHKQIEDYFRCPRSFHYKHVLKLKTSREDGVYLKFHTVLQRTIAELMKSPKTIVNQEFAQEKLKEFWLETDLDEHAYSPIYKAKAEEMLRKMSKRIANESDSDPVKQTFSVEFEHGVVKISPEFLQVENGLIKVRRSKTGKVPQKDGKDENAKIVENEDVLLQTALQSYFAQHEIEMKKFYLSQDEVRQVEPNTTLSKNRLEKYNDALFNIKYGVFPQKPKEDSTCLNCPYFFICPS